MRERLIGIDAGGTMTKAALLDLEGREIACERQPNQMLFPAPGHTERDPDRMWNAAAGAISALLEKTGTSPSDIAAVSASGYGSGIYLVDGRGDPVRPGVVSTDSRAAGLIDDWAGEGRLEPNMQRIQQRIWPGQSIALMGWFDRHEPEVVARTSHVLYCKDFLRARLSGEISTDPTDAGIGGVIDVETSTLAEDMFRDLGLGHWLARMPAIGEPAEVSGRVTEDAARQTGLKPGTPVVRGVVDVTSASLASGVVDASQLSMVAGTFSINSTLHRTPRLSTLPFLQMPYPVDGLILATEGAATSASNFEWVCREILGAEAARAQAAGRSIYDVCNDLIEGALSHDSEILFFPYLFGGPAGAPAGFLGLRTAHGLGDVLRAVFEGVAYAHRMDIERLLGGPDAARPSVIKLAGGASRSELWSQMFADVLGMPLETTDGSELGAQGVAIISAVAIGAQPDVASAIRHMVRRRRRFEPRADRHAFHSAKYARFAELTRVLSTAWPRT